MADINKIKPGDVLWQVYNHRMGNTTIRTTAAIRCLVTEVDLDRRRAKMSWNGNPPQWFYNVKNLRIKEPVLISAGLSGRKRLARRGEKVCTA